MYTATYAISNTWVLVYLLTDREVRSAIPLWEKGELCEIPRVGALLTTPRFPVYATPRYSNFDVFIDPETGLEYVEVPNEKNAYVQFRPYDLVPSPNDEAVAFPSKKQLLTPDEYYGTRRFLGIRMRRDPRPDHTEYKSGIV